MRPGPPLDVRAARHAALGRSGPAGDRRRARPSRTARRSSCASGSGWSRTCWPTTSTCSSGVGLIERSRSSGDGRRRYVHLRRDALDGLAPGRAGRAGPGAVRLHRQLGPLASSPPRCGGRPPARRPRRPAPIPADAVAPRRGRRGPAGRASTSAAAVPTAARRRRRAARRWWSPCATGPTRSSTPTPAGCTGRSPTPCPTARAAAFDAAVAELRDRITRRRRARRERRRHDRPTTCTPPTPSSPSRSRPAPASSASTSPGAWWPRRSAPAS